MKLTPFVATALVLHAAGAQAQQKPMAIDLHALAQRRELHIVDRELVPLIDGAKKGIHVSAADGEWPALLPKLELENGVIEFDVRGKDVQSQSFVGFSFHAADSLTYDAVYFRPFNFRSADSARRAHAVQYVSQPENPWQKLRAEKPGVYEKALPTPPDPNGWFHVRIVVKQPNARVYVDNGKDPVISVSLLGTRSKGRVGLWVGNGTTADFANLRITPSP